MRGAVFTGDRRVELQTFDDPTPGPGEVVVAVQASGMCGSDLHHYRSASPAPTIAGHEPAGVVAAVGAGVTDPVPGQRVMVHHYAGCGSCGQCRSGWPQMCTETTIKVYGGGAHGAHAPYLLVPAVACSPLPDELDFATGAAIGCGTGTAWGALKRLGDVAGSTVLVFGQGPVGQSATMLAAALGATVIAVDPSAPRRASAQRFGAAHVIDPTAGPVREAVAELTAGRMAPFVLETSGTTAAATAGMDSAGPWGRLCFVGLGGRVAFDVRDHFHRQLTLMSSWTMSVPDQRRCADFVVEHALPVAELFSHRWRLEQVVDAYTWFDAQDAGKGVIEFPAP